MTAAVGAVVGLMCGVKQPLSNGESHRISVKKALHKFIDIATESDYDNCSKVLLKIY